MNETLDEPIEKVYWSISEIADKYKVSHTMVRWWIKEFEMNPKRVNGRIKLNEGEIGKIWQIKYLLKDQGFTVRGAKKKLNQSL